MTERRGPILIEEDEPGARRPDPAAAAPVPEPGAQELPEGDAALIRASRFAARRGGWLGRLFWSSLAALLLVAITDAAFSYALSLMASGTLLGFAVLGLLGLFALSVLLIVIREATALMRLSSVEETRLLAARSRAEMSLEGARNVAGRLHRLYRPRAELAWARAAVEERAGDILDADALLDHAEASYMRPLDEAAEEQVRIAARQVAAATALVPLALADVAVALASNLRMIRRIAEIYGGRSGLIESWRLFRAVAAHLIATGAVAVGDDMIGSVLGGGVLARVSRRFGEGVVNGALTARVGVAAMEVCRPVPYHARKRPSVTALVRTALSGMFAAQTAKPGAEGR